MPHYINRYKTCLFVCKSISWFSKNLQLGTLINSKFNCILSRSIQPLWSESYKYHLACTHKQTKIKKQQNNITMFLCLILPSVSTCFQRLVQKFVPLKKKFRQVSRILVNLGNWTGQILSHEWKYLKVENNLTLVFVICFLY